MNETPLNETEIEIKIYKRRWFVLALLVCLIFEMIFVNANFGFLNNILVVYFDTTYATFDWLYLGWNIGTMVAALGNSWLAVKEILTCRRSMIVASILQAINSILVIIGFFNADFLFLLILGQIIGGVSAAVLWSVPTSLAQLWFPESQIGISTGLAYIGSSSGAFAGYLLPAHILKFPTNSTSGNSNATKANWMEYDKNAYQWLFVALLVTPICVMIFLLTLVPEQPEKPPSYAQHLKRINVKHENVTFQFFVFKIRKLVCDYVFIVCAVATSFLYYLPVVYDLCVELIVEKMSLDNYFSPEAISAYIMSLLTFGCWIGNIAGGVVLDKFKRYRLQSTLGTFLSVLFNVTVLLSVYFKNLIALFFSLFCAGMCKRVAYLSLIDSLMQHTYPTDPIFVMPFLIFIQNLVTFLFVEVNRQITYSTGLFGGLSFVCAVLFLVSLICLFFKTKTRRSLAETRNKMDESSSSAPLLSE